MINKLLTAKDADGLTEKWRKKEKLHIKRFNF